VRPVCTGKDRTLDTLTAERRGKNRSPDGSPRWSRLRSARKLGDVRQRQLGTLGAVGVLSLGGGGIGGVWGSTGRTEAVATVRAAYDGGITLFDVAPAYGDGEAEDVLGEAFRDGYPNDARVTTKCRLGNVLPEVVPARLRESLVRSLARIRRDYVDALFLHDFLIPDASRAHDSFADPPPTRSHAGISLSLYTEAVVPAMADLVQQGVIRTWGISGLGVQTATLAAVDAAPKPGVIQCVANLLDSAGDLSPTAEPGQHRELAAVASAKRIGVMGIRAVQAGALTDQFDRKVTVGSRDAADFARAAGFRRLAAKVGFSPAYLAHRYAISMPHVDTVVLGVKNRTELEECLRAAAAGELEPSFVRAVEASVEPSQAYDSTAPLMDSN
jgi:aryl-alcohol dehydrogenase-like predicted oxidoreductase